LSSDQSRSVRLGAYVPISLSQLNGLRLRQNLQQFFLGAGLRFRKEGEAGIRIRSDLKTTSFVEVSPLQDSEGEILPDAQARMDPDRFGLDPGIRKLILREIDHGLRPPTHIMELQVDVLKSINPIGVLQKAARPGMSLWAIRTTEAFRRRQQIFQVFDYLRAGHDPSKFVERPKAHNFLISGLVEFQAASTFCSVLAARNQPLVAVLLTRFLSQVVLVPRHGMFTRESTVQPWSIAFSRISLDGTDRGPYRTQLNKVHKGHGEAALFAAISAANRLLRQLTQPESWIADGCFDFDGRLLACSSIRFGFDAITAVAADWTTHEAIWTAFRAVTILQGFWQCQLSELLDPDRVETHAVPHLLDGDERVRAAGIVSNYRRSLAAAFPGRSSGSVAIKLAQIRNLIHGTRAEGRDPMIRIEVLRSIETAGPSLELIKDIAAFWWTAVLLSPETHGRPRRAPWMRPA